MFRRRDLLIAAAAGLALPRSARASAAKKLVVVFAEGGWDVSFCLDPKSSSEVLDGPDVDEDAAVPEDREAVQTFSGLPIAVNDYKRPAVSAFFGAWGDRCAVINGIWMGAIAHASARVRVLTGTQSTTNPSFAAIAGDALGGDLPLGSIDLSGGSYVGSLAASTGQIGIQSQIRQLVLDDAAYGTLPGRPAPTFALDGDDRDALSAYLAQRNAAARARWSDGGRNDALFDARAEASLRAGRFRSEGAATLAQLTLGQSPSLYAQANLAVDLLAGGLCSAVTLDSRRFWDTHDDNASQHANYQALFEGVDHLMARLSETGQLDDTLVAVISEFTRTPTLNSSGGKDHWPHASFLVAGAGVSPGRVYGGTDDRLESLPVDLATGEVDPGGGYAKYDNVAAGLLTALDVDPGPWFPGTTPLTGPFGA